MKVNVLISGASGTGKTTLAAALSERFNCEGVTSTVTRRLVTRERRLGELDNESDFVSRQTLGWRVGEGIVPFVWPRYIGERTEFYAFNWPAEADVTIFPGNDAIVPHMERFERRFGSTLLVSLVCPQDERERRLQNRSPDLWADVPQLNHRLAEPSLPGFELSPLVVPAMEPGMTVDIVAAAVAGLLRHASRPSAATPLVVSQDEEAIVRLP